MSTTYIPNQPVVFQYSTDSCAEPTPKYVQLATLNDITQFQIKMSPCEDCTNLISAENIYGDPEEWSESYCKYNNGASPLSIYVGNDGQYIQWTFSVSSIQGSFAIIMGATTLLTINSVGTYTITFLSSDDNTLYVVPSTEDSLICFDALLESVACILKTNYRMTIKDSDGNFVAEIDKAWTIAEDSLTTSVEWNQYNGVVEGGCYYICIADPCINTDQQNEEDVNLQEYSTLVNNAVVTASGDIITFTSNTAGSSASVTLSSSNLIDGQCYTITCNTDDLRGVRYRFAHNGSSSPWVATDGTLFSHSFTYHTGDVLQFQFQQHTMLEPPYSVTLFDIKIQVCASAIVCDCCSNMFKIDSGDCTHLVKVCNNKNAFGFVFNGSMFTPNIRLKSRLVRGSYNATRESFEDSLGNKNTIYFKRRKSRQLRVDSVAEYVHDFLSTIAGYDHLYIDNNEYFVDDDEYSVTYATRNDIEAMTTINVSEKIQLVENKNCGDTSTYCNTIEAPDKTCNC